MPNHHDPDVQRYADLAEDAIYDRRTTGQDHPDLDELEELAEGVEHANTNGTLHSMIDAQADYINALVVALYQAHKQLDEEN